MLRISRLHMGCAKDMLTGLAVPWVLSCAAVPRFTRSYEAWATTWGPKSPNYLPSCSTVRVVLRGVLSARAPSPGRALTV